MYFFPRFRSIKEGLIVIAVLSAILGIILICEYRQEKLEKWREGLKDLIYGIGIFIKHMYKRWRKRWHK